MLMLAAANSAPVVARELADALFTEDERRRAPLRPRHRRSELHLVRWTACPDHQACRR